MFIIGNYKKNLFNHFYFPLQTLDKANHLMESMYSCMARLWPQATIRLLRESGLGREMSSEAREEREGREGRESREQPGWYSPPLG